MKEHWYEESDTQPVCVGTISIVLLLPQSPPPPLLFLFYVSLG